MSDILEAVTPQQIEQVRSLFREYQSELPLELSFGQLDSELRNLPGAYSPRKGGLFLATVAGQPVGCVAWRPFPMDGVCEMKRLYVRPPFRTARLGRQLVHHAMSEARQAGYSRMRLDTHPSTMAAAVTLYRRVGFHDVAPDPANHVEGLLYMEVSLRSQSGPMESDGLNSGLQPKR